MLNHLVCGNFHQEEEDEAYLDSPRKPRKRRNKNPYSTRGLDQFSSLLADLDRKRQEIYSKTRPQDISFIRFVQSKSNDIVPIVIKVKDKPQKHKGEELKARYDVASSSQLILEEPPAAVEERKQSKMGSDHEKEEKKNLCCNMWSRPSFYLSVMLIVILGLLTVFGRSVATICTCILWYTATRVKDRSSSRKSIMKKKRYRRGRSEKAAASEDKSAARKFERQKSW